VNRRAELAANLEQVHARIAAACAAAGRVPDEVTLIAVTKTWPAADVRLLAGLGVGDVGENRDREAAAKAAQCRDLPVRWHFLGQLQTNKCRSVVGYADVVHSVDRPRLVTALSAAAALAGRVVTCLVQVNLEEAGAHAGGSAGRGGVRPEDAPALADAVAAAPGLRLGGVMAMAPLDADPGPAFAVLAGAAARVRADHPDARWISAGMSGDLEEAIAAGATHVRVGTAVLGLRPVLR
jgi:pyridoxal phosphate enzyme (YggS family)